MPEDRTDEAMERLGASPLFGGLSKRALRSMASSAKLVNHAAGNRVLEEGGTPMGFHLVIDGTATVQVHGETRRTLGPGDHFGIVSLLDGKPRSASVFAETPMQTLFIAPWVFGPVLQKEPSIAYELLPVLCALLRSAEAPTTTSPA